MSRRRVVKRVSGTVAFLFLFVIFVVIFEFTILVCGAEFTYLMRLDTAFELNSFSRTLVRDAA